MSEEVAVREQENVAQEGHAKKTSRKRTVISLSIISMTAIGLGLGAAFFLHSQLAGGVTTDYTKIDANKLTDDNASLLSTYSSVKKAGGDYVSAFSSKPYQVANIAFQLFSAHDHCFAQGKGVGSAKLFGGSVNQDIRSTVIKDGDHYFEESLSLSGVVNLADRMYQEGDTVVRHVGKVASGDVEKPASLDEGTTYTIPNYQEAMGRDLSNPCIYIVSSKTTYLDQTATSGKPTSFTKTADGYSLELELKTKAVVNYVKQMQTISSLYSKPSFTYVHLSFTLDKDLNPLTMTSHEFYHASTGPAVGSDVEGTLTTHYQTDGSYTIPALMTPISYWTK